MFQECAKRNGFSLFFLLRKRRKLGNVWFGPVRLEEELLLLFHCLVVVFAIEEDNLMM